MEILGTNRGPALRCDLEHSMHPASFSRDLDARFQSPGALNAGGRADFHHQSGEGEVLYLDDGQFSRVLQITQNARTRGDFAERAGESA